jgi:hypothetical protein
MLFNNSDYTVHYDELMLFFNTSSPFGQSLIEVKSGDSTIWTGSEGGSPAVISDFSDAGSLAPWDYTFLEFHFSKNYTNAGYERVLMQFQENGCPAIDSQ